MCYNEAYRCKIKTDLHHHYINADLTLLAEAACLFICTYETSFLWWSAFSSKRLFIKLPWGWLFIKPEQFMDECSMHAAFQNRRRQGLVWPNRCDCDLLCPLHFEHPLLFSRRARAILIADSDSPWKTAYYGKFLMLYYCQWMSQKVKIATATSLNVVVYPFDEWATYM
jgi:hypothetical protein